MSPWKTEMHRARRAARWVVAAAAIAWTTMVATAQQDGFVPMTNVGTETLPASPLLFTAYAFVWVALIAYIFLLWRKIARVERELADVTARLANRR